MQDTRARSGVGNYFQSVRTVLCVAVAQRACGSLREKFCICKNSKQLSPFSMTDQCCNEMCEASRSKRYTNSSDYTGGTRIESRSIYRKS